MADGEMNEEWHSTQAPEKPTLWQSGTQLHVLWQFVSLSFVRNSLDITIFWCIKPTHLASGNKLSDPPNRHFTNPGWTKQYLCMRLVRGSISFFPSLGSSGVRAPNYQKKSADKRLNQQLFSSSTKTLLKLQFATFNQLILKYFCLWLHWQKQKRFLVSFSLSFNGNNASKQVKCFHTQHNLRKISILYAQVRNTCQFYNFNENPIIGWGCHQLEKQWSKGKVVFGIASSQLTDNIYCSRLHTWGTEGRGDHQCLKCNWSFCCRMLRPKAAHDADLGVARKGSASLLKVRQ